MCGKITIYQAVLSDVMSQVGFVNITRQQVRKSDDEHLRGLEAHDINYEAIRFENVSLIVEAQKPEER